MLRDSFEPNCLCFVFLSGKTIPMWKWRDERQQWRLYDQETSEKLELEFRKRPQASCVIKRTRKKQVPFCSMVSLLSMSELSYYQPNSHPSKIMLRIILSQLRAEAEEVLGETQAGFRLDRSTVEQIFNSRVLIKKHLQHHPFHNLRDFKKAFDRVWYEACGRSSEASNRRRTGSSHSGTI